MSDFVEYEVGGAVLEIPSEASEDDVSNIISEFRTTPEFDSLVDKTTGAPKGVRFTVGSIYDRKDKLATLRNFYPDAVEYQDNFVFTNPNTGKPTLYNPEGLDVGDIASISREGVQTVTGGLGAAAGLIVGGPAGAVVGSGLGTATGGSVFDLISSRLDERVDTRSLPRRQADFAAEVATAALGEKAGRAIAPLTKKALGGGKAMSQRIVGQLRDFGIEPSAAVATGGKGLGRVEAAVSQSAAGGQVLEEQAEQVVKQTSKAVNKFVTKIGEPKTKQGAGDVIKRAAARSAERFEFKQEKIYGEAFDLIGGDTSVGVEAIKKLKEDMIIEMADAPRSLEPALKTALDKIHGIIADAGEEGIKFGALRRIRTAIGKDLATPQLTGSSGAQNEAMKRVYGALTQDLSESAANVSTKAAQKLKAADRFTRMWMNTAKDTMEKIVRFDADEKAFKFALNSGRDGGSALTRMKRHFTKEEWDVVSASVLNQLGNATPGMQDAAGDVFSINTFMTNWNRLAQEAKDALFGSAENKVMRQSLDDLVEVIGELRNIKRYANVSNTSGSIHTLLALNALGASGGALATGDVEGAGLGTIATVSGTILAPRLAAKLLTNPSFVTWLSTPVKEGVSSVPAHIGRLSAISEANPEIKEEIDEFMKILSQNTNERSKKK